MYIAPEIYNLEGRNEAYKQPLDCWAAGVTMFYMLSGEYPFQAPDLQDKICEENFEFDSSRWLGVSFEAKDLIRKLLVKDPQNRLTA